ncbi:hypothetical protein [Thalassobacillus sp. CUG 92003]|uniref:hypothetical protein n=1 Tax=Thalassobacillus sp. CUG 92003 TaxID=2736641 RepID=UPI0015E6C2AE|nr:hypothetical protein [Thalassobacillus sp. CUG 92003]
MNFPKVDKGTSEIIIGVIGPDALINQIKETLKSFPNFTPIFCTVTPATVVTDVAKELMDDVDVLMFTEYHLYYLAKQLLDFSIPVHYIPLMGTGLYRSLFLIKNNYEWKQLSIDTIDEKYVQQILFELNEQSYDYNIFHSGNSHVMISDIIDFHMQNHTENQAIPLTGIQDVSKKLIEMNVPHEWVTPTHQDITVSLERALLATRTRQNKESQIVFGLIDIDHFQQVTEKYPSEHDVQLLKLQIQQMLLDYIKQLDGHLINLGGEEYSFITTRGIFERETRGYKFIPLLQDSKSKIGITLSIGVGFGSSAAEAGNHARLALRQSKGLGGNVCYIVREDRSVLGPVDITTHTQYERYDLSITDAQLLDKAGKAGMSATYMTKLMARVSRYKKYDYTAQELASTLKITVRSAHRILLKWMDAELVDIIGEEKVTHKGRPRRIYRLSFIVEEEKAE